MKTAQDPRHLKRIKIIQDLFKFDYYPQEINSDTKKILNSLKIIDKQISVIAPEYPIDKINKVDLAILRLGMYELTIDKSVPINVVIDESIELAKEYGGESSPAFINGALGNYVKNNDSKI